MPLRSHWPCLSLRAKAKRREVPQLKCFDVPQKPRLGDVMDIGEAVALSLTKDDTECPFCKSPAEPDFKKLVLINDSLKLAQNAGGKPAKAVESPPATDDYEIFDDYWISEDTSEVVPNAHHVLPGNASIARASGLLKWIAGEVSVRKEEKGKTRKAAVDAKKKQLSPNLSPSARQAAYEKIVSDTLPVVEDGEGQVVWAARGGKIDKHYGHAKKNHVTGQVDLDINAAFNNMWLPSHCAIADWSDIKEKDAWHMHQDPETDDPIAFKLAYAYNAMEEFEVQFHDAHPDYSAEVLEELEKIDFKLTILSKECLLHPNTRSKKNGPFPAPKQLEGALIMLAHLVKIELNIMKTYPAVPWFTSQLSLDVTEYWK